MTRIFLIASAAVSLAGAAQAQGGFGGGPPDLDADHDGKVTFEEFKAGAGGGRMIQRLDADRDGRISKAEYQVMVDRMSQFGGPEAAERVARRFAQDDADHDGFLTIGELDAAAKRRFDAADANHDGWLSEDELLTMRQNRRGGAGG